MTVKNLPGEYRANRIKLKFNDGFELLYDFTDSLTISRLRNFISKNDESGYCRLFTLEIKRIDDED